MPLTIDTTTYVLGAVRREINRAILLYPQPFNSPPEGYAVILEEVDELWDEIRKRHALRSVDAMREEAIQIAAMAVRFVVDLCIPTDGSWGDVQL